VGLLLEVGVLCNDPGIQPPNPSQGHIVE
jgi:hypothetical protein